MSPGSEAITEFQPATAEERRDRLSSRIMDVVMAIASENIRGGMVHIDAVRDRAEFATPAQVADSLRWLKEAGRIFGRGGGWYEIPDCHPPARRIAVSRLTDGWYLLEMDDREALCVTAEEFAHIGDLAGGAVARKSARSYATHLEQEIVTLKRKVDLLERSKRRN